MSEILTKKMVLFDDNDLDEKYTLTNRKTVVEVINKATGETIFKGPNKVLFPGAEYSAMQQFNVNANSVVPTYSEIMNIDTDAALTSKEDANAVRRNYLFCIGTDGCGPEASQRYPVNFTKPMLPAELVDDPTLGYMIPFKFMNTANPLDKDPGFRSKYFGRRIETIGTTGGSWIAYYFKKFENDPILLRQYVDGTSITKNSDLYHSTKTDEAQCFIQLKLTITNEDFRDFFALTVGPNQAKWNSLSICSGIPATYTVNGVTYPYYKDIIPYSKINIPNAPLNDTSMQYDIIYQLYY